MGTAISHLSGVLGTVTGYITGLGVAGGGAMIGYHALARNMNDEPQHVSHHTASIRKVVTGTAIVAVAGTIATFAAHLL